jgi:hypothetical protein
LIEKIKVTRDSVRKFGILFSIIGVLLAGYLIYRGNAHWHWALVGSFFFLVTAFVGYPVLRPLYIGWMAFAFVLGWINTRLLLGVFFYLILTPIGLVLRLGGKDLLDQKIDRSARSYWKKREKQAFDPARYERLF